MNILTDIYRLMKGGENMEMNDIVNMVLNSSVSIVVIGYFMYRDFKFMGQLQQTLQSLVDTVGILKDFMAHDIKTKGDGKNE